MLINKDFLKIESGEKVIYQKITSIFRETIIQKYLVEEFFKLKFNYKT